MISMDREDWNGDVDVGVLVVDAVGWCTENLLRITQKLQLTGLHAQTVFPQRLYDLIHGFSRWLIVMEEVAAKKNHVNVLGFRYLHDLIEGPPAIIFPDWIPLCIAHMIVGRHQYADSVLFCWRCSGLLLAPTGPWDRNRKRPWWPTWSLWHFEKQALPARQGGFRNCRIENTGENWREYWKSSAVLLLSLLSLSTW